MSTQIRETRRDPGDGPHDDPWRSFRGQVWRDSIDTRRFIQDNYAPYEGDAGFLAGPTERTTGIWARLTAMFPVERERGVYDVDAHTPSSITAHAPGYIDRDAELIVGLQTDAPLKRAIMPNGGWRVVETGLRTYGCEVDPRVKEIFTKYRKTHNDGVFDTYTAEILGARRAHIITGLPDAYGRGRINGEPPGPQPGAPGPTSLPGRRQDRTIGMAAPERAHLGASDAFTWCTERGPALRSTIAWSTG